MANPRKGDTDRATLEAAATCPRAALREGGRRKEIRKAVAAFFVLNRRAASVADVATITGRSEVFTAARVETTPGVELVTEGCYPEGRTVAGCLIEVFRAA